MLRRGEATNASPLLECLRHVHMHDSLVHCLSCVMALLADTLQDPAEHMASWEQAVQREAPCMQGFLTAVLQNHARLTQTPIDQLSFGFRVMQEQEAEQLASGPAAGAYLSGLHLEGARWAAAHATLHSTSFL